MFRRIRQNQIRVDVSQAPVFGCVAVLARGITVPLGGSGVTALNHTAVCAAALAFIVIYNLTNINITERLREIATVKVLGFYQWESAIYVLRENIVLTVLGALVGIPLGFGLNSFIINAINVDLIRFTPQIAFRSFAISLLLTFVFSILVDFLMYFRLNRINTAEALKAAE